MNRRYSLALLGGLLASCGSKPAARSAVLYSSLDESYAAEIATLFREKTGIAVQLVSDTEVAKSTGLVNRLIAEKDHPQCDVFLSGDVMRAALLKNLGLTAKLPAGVRTGTGLSAEYDDPDGEYACMAARLRLIIVNKDKAGAGDRPRSVLDLAQPEFAARTCLANPLFGTTSMHAAAVFGQEGDAAARNFFASFAAGGGRMLASNGEVRRRVASGEFCFGLTDSDDVSVAIRDGQPVEFIIPDQESRGAVVIPCAVSIIKGAPHPAEAAQLAEFLVSADVEKLLSENEAAHLPLRTALAPPPVFPRPLAQLRRAPCDPAALAAAMTGPAGEFLKEWVELQSR